MRIQQKLLSSVDEQSLSSLRHWQTLYARLYTLSALKMQEQVLSLLEQSGMSIRFLTDDRSLFVGELQVGARETLLFSLDIPDSSATTASLITTALAGYQAALHACLRVAGSLPINIKWVCDGRVHQHNFTGSASNRREHDDLLRADTCVRYLAEQKAISRDVFPILALGTKGSLNVELTVRTTNAPIEAQYGTIAPNAAWQLLWALNTLKDRREDILIEGFYDAVLPMEDEVIEAIARLADHAPSLATQWGLEEPFLGLQGLQQYLAYFLTPNCTISSIHSETPEEDQRAFLPQTARALLDFQLVPQQDPFDIYSKLQNHLLNQNHETLQARLLHAIQPAYTPLSDPLIKSTIQATTAAYGRPPQILPLLPADNSSSLLQGLRLSTVMVPLPFVIAELQDLSHAFYQESFIQHIKQTALLIAGTLSTEKESAMSSNL